MPELPVDMVWRLSRITRYRDGQRVATHRRARFVIYEGKVRVLEPASGMVLAEAAIEGGQKANARTVQLTTVDGELWDAVQLGCGCGAG